MVVQSSSATETEKTCVSSFEAARLAHGGPLVASRREERVGKTRLQIFDFIGANARDRTADLLITNQLLYRLSYVGSQPPKGITRACVRQAIAVVRAANARRCAGGLPMQRECQRANRT